MTGKEQGKGEDCQIWGRVRGGQMRNYGKGAGQREERGVPNEGLRVRGVPGRA